MAHVSMENICQKLNYGFQDFFFLNLQVRILILTELFRKLIELKALTIGLPC